MRPLKVAVSQSASLMQRRRDGRQAVTMATSRKAARTASGARRKTPMGAGDLAPTVRHSARGCWCARKATTTPRPVPRRPPTPWRTCKLEWERRTHFALRRRLWSGSPPTRPPTARLLRGIRSRNNAHGAMDSAKLKLATIRIKAPKRLTPSRTSPPEAPSRAPPLPAEAEARGMAWPSGCLAWPPGLGAVQGLCCMGAPQEVSCHRLDLSNPEVLTRRRAVSRDMPARITCFNIGFVPLPRKRCAITPALCAAGTGGVWLRELPGPRCVYVCVMRGGGAQSWIDKKCNRGVPGPEAFPTPTLRRAITRDAYNARCPLKSQEGLERTLFIFLFWFAATGVMNAAAKRGGVPSESRPTLLADQKRASPIEVPLHPVGAPAATSSWGSTAQVRRPRCGARSP